MLYHPYVFAFSYGIGFVMAFTGLIINGCSISLFGNSRMQKYMILIDITMLLQSIIARWFSRTTEFWIAILLLSSTYSILFSMYTYFRCYNMMSLVTRRIGLVGYAVTYIAFIIYEAGVRGFLPVFEATVIYLAVLPFVFGFAFHLLIKIVMLIVANPIYHNNHRQERLMIISNYTIVCALLVAAPTAILCAVGSWYKISILWDSNIGFTPCIALVCTISNLLMTANKNIEIYVAPEASGISVFKSDKIILSVLEEECAEKSFQIPNTILEEVSEVGMKHNTFIVSNSKRK